jgi:hypothetical protein
MKLIALVSLGLILSFHAAPGSARALCEVATSASGGAIPRCIGKVEDLFLHRDFVRISMEGDEMALASQCTPFDRTFLDIPVNDPRLNHYISMLLAAQLSGRPLTVRVLSDAQGMCSVVYMRMVSE